MASWVAMAGSAPAFVSDSAVALIPGGEDAVAAIARIESAALPASLVEALDRVLAGGPVASAPPFFIAVREGQQWRCAVRGAITVTIDGSEKIAGDSVTSWWEFTAPESSPLEVEVRDAEPVSWHPVGDGPPRIGALRREPEATGAPKPKRTPKATVVESKSEAVVNTETPEQVNTAVSQGNAVATMAGVRPEAAQFAAPARYDDLFGELTVAGGVAAAAVLEDASSDVEAAHTTDTATGFDHSEVAVSAILCPHDHPNPPERGRCWRCAATLDSSAVVRVARPALGTVVLDDGRVVDIDRMVLLGRSPRAERTDAAHLPALVSVGSEAPGVSRTHARIFVDGWQVLVEDLGSTFGSTLIGADGATRRLRPGQPELVNGDSVLDLGGGSRVRLMGVP